MRIDACIPCFNNEHTIKSAIRSILGQDGFSGRVVVFDDGSTDSSVQHALQAGAEVYRLPHSGRGSVRARAMQEVQSELVLWCDATASLGNGFLSHAVKWFEQENVAGVFGRVIQPENRSILDRWRGRHLFRMALPHGIRRRTPLSTGGCLLARKAVLAVGNFDPRLSSLEDVDLGNRLFTADYDVVYDPALFILPLSHNSLPQLFERYWRWNGYPGYSSFSWRNVKKLLGYSYRVMVKEDIVELDFPCLLVTMLLPWYILKKQWMG